MTEKSLVNVRKWGA